MGSRSKGLRRQNLIANVVAVSSFNLPEFFFFNVWFLLYIICLRMVVICLLCLCICFLLLSVLQSKADSSSSAASKSGYGVPDYFM